MKPLTKKILEAGLVEKTSVQLMEKWGQIDRGASSLVNHEALKGVTEETFNKFAEEVEVLMDEDREAFKETKLEFRVGEPLCANWGESKVPLALFRDNMGNFLFSLNLESMAVPGSKFRTRDGCVWRILDKQTLYLGDNPYLIQVRVEELPGWEA